MKISGRRDWRSGARTLVIVAGKHENFEYAQAEWLKNAQEEFLLPFTYDSAAENPQFYYDLTEVTKLKRYLKARITASQYADMLSRIYSALAMCTRLRYPTSSLRFEVDHVYVDVQGGLRFAFVPLSDVREDKANSARQLISFLSSGSNLHLTLEEDERHRIATLDFIRRTPVLSLNTLAEFLDHEFGIVVNDVTNTASSSRSTSDEFGDPIYGHGAVQAATPASFDMVGMLTHRNSSSEIVAKQSVAERTLDEVAGISPTSADRVQAKEASKAEKNETVFFGSPTSPYVVKHSSASKSNQTVFLERHRDGMRWPLDLTKPVIVGRSKTCDISLEDNHHISRQHVRLSAREDGNGFLITDLRSANGTIVAGRKLAPGACASVMMGETFMLADEVVQIVK